MKNSKENMVLVSVCMITYNHDKYIREALDGVVIQKTNFRIELVIGEDCSTDGTREICEEYADKYPDLIQLLPSKHNLGMNKNGVRTLNACTGKYIALCEGDDYWTDPFKLQKQVDFLEENEDFGICFHNVEQINNFTEERCLIPGNYKDVNYSFEDYILQNRTATCSMVFRKEYLPQIPTWFYNTPFGDLALILLIMDKTNKKGHVFKDVMGVYRIHSDGIHGKFQESEEGLVKAYREHLKFTTIISSELLNSRYKKVIRQKKYNTYKLLAMLYKKLNQNRNYFKALTLMRYYQIIKF